MVASVGLARVVEPAGVLPQAAWRLDPRPEIGADEVRIRVERLNLDAASFRQLAEKHGGDGDAVRAEVLEIIGTRGKMHNPVTGSGGMLIGVVDQVGPQSPLGLKAGDRVATLVSLTLTRS
jgi:L-erythro-3,5-diaminohexanoate dehydrogenase